MSTRKGIDMDAVKSRLEKFKKTNKNSNLTWRPNEKEQTIRIVPYKYQPDNPFVELYFHYGLNGKTYLSPISFNEPDPIMEVAQKLKNAGDKESWKMGKDLEPKLRTFAPVVVRGKEAEGVKFWGFGKTIYEQLLTNIADPECGDITDPVTGRDIVVSTVKEEGKQFASPKMRIKMTQTPVTTDPEIINKIVKEQPDIRELYELKSYEELEAALRKHLNPEEEEEAPEETDETPAKTETATETTDDAPKTETTPAKAEEEAPKKEAMEAGDVKAAFANLFEQD